MTCAFMVGGHIVIQYAVAMVRFDFALYKNDSLEVEGEGSPSGYTQDRYRTGSTTEGRSFTPNVVSARTGDVFEVHVRHNVGAEVFLASKDKHLPEHLQFVAPTANFFMGIYEAF